MWEPRLSSQALKSSSSMWEWVFWAWWSQGPVYAESQSAASVAERLHPVDQALSERLLLRQGVLESRRMEREVLEPLQRPAPKPVDCHWGRE